MFKHFKPSTLFLLLTIALGCSKSHDSTTAIDGTWQMTKTTNSNCNDATKNGTDDITNGNIITFSGGNWTFKDSNGAVQSKGTYTISGTKVTIKFSTPGYPESTFDFTVSGNQLTLSLYDGGIKCTVTNILTKK